MLAILLLSLLLWTTCPSSPVPDLMTEAVSQGKAELELWLRGGSPKRDLLCATFLSTNQSSFQTTLTNSQTLKCDWVVVFYNMSDAGRKRALCDELASKVRVVHCEGAMVRYNSSLYRRLHFTPSFMNNYDALLSRKFNPNMSTLPKQAMYLDLLPYLPNYRRVLLLDSDMLFSEFNFDLAMRIWDCAFHPPPLVVQAAIVGKTLCRENRARWWKNFGNRTRSRSTEFVLAGEIPYIEQQAPFLHAGFLYWFLKSVLRRYTLFEHLEKANDWGTDTIWCGAGRAFGRYVLDYENYSIPCALITGAGPVYHTSTKTINKNIDFMNSGLDVFRVYKSQFKRW